MDLNVLSLIWTVLLVPIGWLAAAWNKQKSIVDKLTLDNANLKKDVEVIQARFKKT